MHCRHRSSQKEILDQQDIAPEELFRNLDELHIINRQLGGYSVSCSGLGDILKSTSESVNAILDIGFGGGHTIERFSEFCRKNKLNLYFYGVDLKNDCLLYAQKRLMNVNNKELICDDYRNISQRLLEKIDVIHCSLFLHHLSNEEIVALLKFARQNHCVFLANDLHRHWFAFYSIKFLTSFFSKSYLVKNDAPLSVKRGFKKQELVRLIREAGFTNFSVKWRWAFRYQIIART